MSIHHFRSRLMGALAAAAALVPYGAYADAGATARLPSRLVVFGDSLSDPGNVFVTTGEYSVRPFAPIPSAPYAIGGLHFTNGSTWVERLSRSLGTPSGAGPALRAPQVYANYAFGGARARAGGPSGSPDLGGQVAMYLAQAGNAADSDALYVVWFGANDVRDALQSLALDPTGAAANAILQGAIGAIAANVVMLRAAGAREFLVPNVPNLASVPAVASQPPAVRAAAAQLSAAYNGALAQTLGGLEAQLGVRIVRLDVAALLAAVLAQPAAYGLENVTEPCLRFGVIVDAICRDPRDHAFWDAIHPTAAVHAILAQQAAAALE
jgi:outer membrane lipase/esterase